MEFVYVVPRDTLFPEYYPHGVEFFGKALSEATLQGRISEGGFFVERSYAEIAPTLKQVIPYSIVVRDSQVFLLKRTRAGGEKRLHDKLSIGVGGHINPVDLGETSAPHGRSRNPIPAATRRELEEELKIGPEALVRTVGILNDDSNPVGAVHVGLVQILTVQGAVEVRETDQLQGRFADPAELRGLLKGGADFESWSGLLIPHLDQLLSQAVALAAL